MVDIIEYPHVEFIDVTEEMRTPEMSEPPQHETWQCWFNGSYFGSIGFDIGVEQYVFYPVVGEQLVLTFSILNDIMFKIHILMKDRKVN